MKKLFILPAALVCTFALFFVGCGDDEDSGGGDCISTYCSCIGDGMDAQKIASCGQAAADCVAAAGSSSSAGTGALTCD